VGPTTTIPTPPTPRLHLPDLRNIALYDRFQDAETGKELKRSQMREPFRAKEELAGLELSQPEIPGPGWTNTPFDVWRRFLAGGWLEQWTGELAAVCGLPSPRVSVNARWHGRSTELDVVGVRANRLYTISCTTAGDRHLPKLKLFEVALRARQLGEDLARSALVCLLDGQGGRLGPDDLERDGRASWEAPNPPKVFGLPHLRAWAAGGQSGAGLSALRAWVAS